MLEASLMPDARPVVNGRRRITHRQRICPAIRLAIARLYSQPWLMTDDEVDRIVDRIGLPRVLSSLDRSTRPSSLVAAE